MEPQDSVEKQRQRDVWQEGDFAVVASRNVLVAESLIENADFQADWRVLDVATGTGNGALAVARRGCEATGLDFVPALLDRGRLRAEAECLSITFVHGDAEALPFDSGSFDGVVSVFGAMFAPYPARTARELVRVCRPGGRIALASWTPSGFVGELTRLVGTYLPTQSEVSPMMWGEEHYLCSLFGREVNASRSAVRQSGFLAPSADEYVGWLRRYFGPIISAFAALSTDRQAALTRDIAKLARRFDRNGGKGPLAIASDYLETVMTRC